MKLTGIILIVLSILIFVAVSFTNLGSDPLPPGTTPGSTVVTHPGWPLYLGAFALASGIFLLIGRPKKS